MPLANLSMSWVMEKNKCGWFVSLLGNENRVYSVSRSPKVLATDNGKVIVWIVGFL